MVGESLSFVDFLHLGRVAVLRCEDEQRSVHELVRDGNFLNILAKVVLVPVSQRLVHLLKLLGLFLGDLIVVENLDVFLRDRLNLTLFILTQVLSGELIDWIVKDKHLVTLLNVLGKDR